MTLTADTPEEMRDRIVLYLEREMRFLQMRLPRANVKQSELLTAEISRVQLLADNIRDAEIQPRNPLSDSDFVNAELARRKEEFRRLGGETENDIERARR